MINYSRELRIGVDIKRKGKVEKAGTALRKVQKEIKQQADKRRKEIEKWKKDNEVMLSMKDIYQCGQIMNANFDIIQSIVNIS